MKTRHFPFKKRYPTAFLSRVLPILLFVKRSKMMENMRLPLIFTVSDAVFVPGFWALGNRKQNFNVYGVRRILVLGDKKSRRTTLK